MTYVKKSFKNISIFNDVKHQFKESDRTARKQFVQNFATQMAGGLQALAFKSYDKGGERWLNTLTPAQWIKVFAHQFSFVKGV